MGLKQFALLVCVAALAACSSEPSSDDIRAAVEKNIEKSNAAARSMAGAMGGKQASDMLKGMESKVHSVKKVGCKKDGEAFVCDVDADIETAFTRIQQVMPMRLVKGTNGWDVSSF